MRRQAARPAVLRAQRQHRLRAGGHSRAHALIVQPAHGLPPPSDDVVARRLRAHDRRHPRRGRGHAPARRRPGAALESRTAARLPRSRRHPTPTPVDTTAIASSVRRATRALHHREARGRHRARSRQRERRMLPLLIDAAREMHGIYWMQAIGPAIRLMRSICAIPTARTLADINVGPWDRLDNNAPFVAGVGPKPAGANFYPHDMTQGRVRARRRSAAGARADSLKSLYTMVRRDAAGALTPFRTRASSPTPNAARRGEAARRPPRSPRRRTQALPHAARHRARHGPRTSRATSRGWT